MTPAAQQPSLPFDLPSRHGPASIQSAGSPVVATVAPEFVRHPAARRYVVRVRADGSVRVTLPRWGSKKEALAFVEQQRSWIDKQRARAEREMAEQPAPMSADVQRELQARAREELPARLLDLARQLGVSVSRVSIRNQRWRWGSCSRTGHICLNWRLIVMPDWVRDYVLIHELMHRKRLDHSPKFWRLVARACPAYNDARAWLRAYPRAGFREATQT